MASSSSISCNRGRNKRMILRLLFLFTCFLVHRSHGSPLHGACLSNDDCGTIDTFCRNQTCVCREHFTVWYDSCVQMPSSPLRCSKKQECHLKLGARSMCTKKGQCVCKPFHHLHQGQCVKNRDLHDQCEHDHQCYCGADCNQKIACIDKNCTCKPGHVPYRIRRCIHDPAYIDIPDESIFTTTVHKHKSVAEAEHNSSRQAEHNSSRQAESKSVEQSEHNKFEPKENSVEPTVVHALTSSSNILIFNKYFIAILILVTLIEL